MKIQWNKRDTTIAVYCGVVGCLIVLLTLIFLNFNQVRALYNVCLSVLNPLIIGLIIAYLLNPMASFYQKKVFAFTEKKKPHPILRRALGVTLAFLTMAVFLGILFLFVVPQVAASYTDLQSKAAGYVGAVLDFLEKRVGESGVLREQYDKLLSYLSVDKIGEMISTSLDVIIGSTSVLFSFFGRFLNQIKNILLGLVFSIYVLVDLKRLKAAARKVMCALFRFETREKIYDVLKRTDHIFGGFIIGNVIDSVFVGAIIFIILGILRIPYYPLVSVIVGVTNMIPFFGPFIGTIPSAFIIFVADPLKALWFVIVILVVQQIDGNFIIPKILGDNTGLSALSVIVAITIMSGLLGITGMFIGVPVFAVLYSFVKDAVEKRLRRYHLPTDTEAYMSASPSEKPQSDRGEDET